MGEVLQITSGILKIPTQFFLTQTECYDPVIRKFAEKKWLGNPGKLCCCSRRQLPELIQLDGSRQFQLVSESFRRHLQGQQSLFRYTYCYFNHISKPVGNIRRNLHSRSLLPAWCSYTKLRSS